MKRTKVGFSGTREGMSKKQRWGLIYELNRFKWRVEGHHGDCEGFDEEVHAFLALRSQPTIVIHPPIDIEYRAFCEVTDTEFFGYSGDNTTGLIPKRYLERNRDIVDATELLIAAPLRMNPMSGGGTWYTIQYAQEQRKPVVLLDR